MERRTTPEGNARVTVIPGDGIGPEVVRSAQRVIEASGAKVEEERLAGAEIFKQGPPSGVPPETIESIRKTRVVLKGPLETPIGFGEKSANVTLRKLFETYANIRPARELPGVPTPYSGRGIDMVIVRENVEDLYAGIEHMQTPGVAQTLKLISRKGCEKIVRFAFELARAEGRRTVHVRDEGEHHEADRGDAEAHVRGDRARVPGLESWHLIVDNYGAPAGEEARAVRRDRHDEHERRHPVRRVQRAGRGPGLRAEREHRERGRDLRGRARLGAQVRG